MIISLNNTPYMLALLYRFKSNYECRAIIDISNFC